MNWNWFNTGTLGDVCEDNADYGDNAGSRVFLPQGVVQLHVVLTFGRQHKTNLA